ncbi:MAG: hypothetical protein M0T70_08505 [Geobacteraceae bacterium]|nr:hypothetical protein [Geobacteraceae bacterium]
MVNLLFISNSTKIDAIRNALQPFLKVKIDIVADFDFGLKDVFEKRPATVFIQDQIAGVTGESVARHIQMLLGAGSPSFIYMHEASSKAKQIKGLFEYLIDLSQADAKIVADIQATLKTLLGPQWEKIYVPPQMDNTSIGNVAAVPDDSSACADQLIDDLISGLDAFGTASSGNKSPTPRSSAQLAPVNESFHVVSSPQDQLAEMLAETHREQLTPEAATVTTQDLLKGAQVPDATQQRRQPTLSNHPESPVSVASSISAQPQPVLKGKVAPDPSVHKKPDADVTVPPAPQSVPENRPLQQASPADFVILGEHPDEVVAPEDLLRVFEGNYYSRPGRGGRNAAIAFVLAICFGGGFWYLKQKPQLLAHLIAPSDHAAVVATAGRPAESAITIQKPVTSPALKSKAPTLPSFIPQSGLDSSFSSQKPGWERYADASFDFRIYRIAGRIKALQVLGVNNHGISETKMKSILIELLGDGEYRVKSREQKLGYHVLRATVGQKAELLIYRKKTTIRAFVVSLD